MCALYDLVQLLDGRVGTITALDDDGFFTFQDLHTGKSEEANIEDVDTDLPLTALLMCPEPPWMPDVDLTERFREVKTQDAEKLDWGTDLEVFL